MVVQFAPDKPPDGCPAASSVAKQYVTARTRERKSLIFDYVHLSSSLVRKVRYGQSLDAALQTRSPWTGETSSSPAGFRRPRSSSAAPSPASIWRDRQSPHKQSVASSPKRRAVILNQQRHEMHKHGIQYGRQIQLQATDSGFLALDTTGELIKLPHTHRDDPRTLLTLFPHDPLLALGSKSHVCTGELCFVVVGAATITTTHDVLYADAKRTCEPPTALLNAVVRHQRQQRSGRGASSTSQRDLLSASPRNVKTTATRQSTVWSFRAASSTAKATALAGARELLTTGMLVQLQQRDATMHYETERIVKKRYTPTPTPTPTTTASGPEVEEDPRSLQTHAAHNSTDSLDIDTEEEQRGAPRSTHRVWLQHNDISAQHDAHATPKLWDNLWFLIDVATERELEQQRKQQQAIHAAEHEADARAEEDTTRTHSHSHPTRNTGNNHDDGRMSQHTTKPKVSVPSSIEATQRHAAAIIVRFLRSVSRRDAERRANDVIDRRIRRTGKHQHQHPPHLHPLRRGPIDDSTLTTTQQLRILQCFNPTVYGSQRVMEPLGLGASRRIPGISLQGSKYPRQEATRLATMQRDLTYLGSAEFQPQPVVHQRSTRQQDLPPRPLARTKPLQHLQHPHPVLRERDHRDHHLHVQLAMAHREKPPFRFGKSDLKPRLHACRRPQTAPASPCLKPKL